MARVWRNRLLVKLMNLIHRRFLGVGDTFVSLACRIQCGEPVIKRAIRPSRHGQNTAINILPFWVP